MSSFLSLSGSCLRKTLVPGLSHMSDRDVVDDASLSYGHANIYMQ
jgi:hypothetical protein